MFKLVTPFRVVTTLKLPLRERDGSFFTEHPQHPEHEFEIGPQEFVGLRYNSPTPGLGVFDFLALHLGSYEEAVDFAIREFFNLAMVPAPERLPGLREHFIRSLKDERQQFEEILALGQPLRTYCPQLGVAYMYCRRLGVEPHHAGRMFYVTSGETINNVLHYARQSVRPLNAKELYWVFPYLRSHHVFGLLEIEDAQGKLVRTVRLNPSHYLYFGLHSELGDCSQTRIFATRKQALEAYGYAMKMSRFGIGFLHLASDLKAAPDPPRKKAIFVVAQKEDFNTLVSNRPAFEQFEVAGCADEFAETLQPIPWSQYALTRITEAIKLDGDYSPQVPAMIRSLRNDPFVFSSLLSHFERQKQLAILEQIRKLADEEPLFTSRGIEVREMSNGLRGAQIRPEYSVSIHQFFDSPGPHYLV